MPPLLVCLFAWYFGEYFLSTGVDLVASLLGVKLYIAYVKLHKIFLIKAV